MTLKTLIILQITYSLLDDLETFGIDEVTGVVTSTARFDRETRSSYRLVAVATDQGSNRLSAQTTVSGYSTQLCR